jgi:hypothetical protein
MVAPWQLYVSNDRTASPRDLKALMGDMKSEVTAAEDGEFAEFRFPVSIGRTESDSSNREAADTSRETADTSREAADTSKEAADTSKEAVHTSKEAGSGDGGTRPGADRVCVGRVSRNLERSPLVVQLERVLDEDFEVEALDVHTRAQPLLCVGTYFCSAYGLVDTLGLDFSRLHRFFREVEQHYREVPRSCIACLVLSLALFSLSLSRSLYMYPLFVLFTVSALVSVSVCLSGDCFLHPVKHCCARVLLALVQVPYHSALHAADVLVSMNRLLSKSSVPIRVAPLDLLAIYVACAGAASSLVSWHCSCVSRIAVALNSTRR